MKREIEKLGKSELRKKQDLVLEKKSVDFPELNFQGRIVGVNKNVIFSLALAGSLLMNWLLFKKVNGLGSEVEKLGRTHVSVEVKNQGLNAEEQQRYLDRKLSQMKNEILDSIQQKDQSNFQPQAIGGRGSQSHSIVPSALELIEQIDIQQYTVADAEQYSNFRSLLSRLSRMRSKYRMEIQNIVSAYSQTHQISGVDSDEYYALLEKRRDLFVKINSLHEKVKKEWKLKNKVALDL